jgi:hypothetical protein
LHTCIHNISTVITLLHPFLIFSLFCLPTAIYPQTGPVLPSCSVFVKK